MKPSFPSHLRSVLTSRQGPCTRAGRVLSSNNTIANNNNNTDNHHSGSRRQIHILSQPFTSQSPTCKGTSSIHDGRGPSLKSAATFENPNGTIRATSVRLFSSGAKRDLYEVLGVPKSANKAEIKKSYFKLAKKYHPDTNKVGSSRAAKSEMFWIGILCCILVLRIAQSNRIFLGIHFLISCLYH